jgi:hypothetical protein
MIEFDEECMHFYGEVLTGKYKHFCPDFDYLPIDESCFEYQFCTCEWEDQ